MRLLCVVDGGVGRWRGGRRWCGGGSGVVKGRWGGGFAFFSIFFDVAELDRSSENLLIISLISTIESSEILFKSRYFKI